VTTTSNSPLDHTSNFETKSQAIEAAYEEHVRAEKNMGNWERERRSRGWI